MLSRPEIIANAAKFAETWKEAKDEDAEAKSFWDALFLVYGTPRKNVATFEHKVKRADGSQGYIDLLWKGKLLVEHKSLGRSLPDARKQAQEYINGLKVADRPEWLVVSDFQNFEIVKQADGTEYKFKLEDFDKNIDLLGFIGGFTPRAPVSSTPVNIKAVELLGDVYDALKDGGYPADDLAPLLVRLLFALFAEDTAIFDPEQFRNLILDKTKEDGSDLGSLINSFFEVLNTPESKRQKHLDVELAKFPYVNGALFNHHLPNAAMNKVMRDAILAASEFDWTQISPAIFGSLFQSVMESKERRALGAHYTSEDDILKLIKPLFLDELDEELDNILADKSSRKDARLDAFHNKISDLKFLDPACGCGNFLIIAYRELRRLETKLLIERHRRVTDRLLDISHLAKINVDDMYGIEIEEFPAEIAKVGMWLMDHICNTQLAAAFGKSFTRLPLIKSATIKCDNALTTDWNSVISADHCHYVIGNPPFVGKKEQTQTQKTELQNAFSGSSGVGNLDYVCSWYAKAADYISGTNIRCAFVSTNSISQGEQVSELWKHLFARNIKIDFAHRTFVWKSEARGAAHVHVVIIGFSLTSVNIKSKYIYDHSDASHVRVITATNINPYLIDFNDIFIDTRTTPISPSAPIMNYGSMMIDKARSAGDDEGLVFDQNEKDRIINECPNAANIIRKIYGGVEYINGEEKYCLWIPSTPPSYIQSSKIITDRINKVRAFRTGSGRRQTNVLASYPYRFGEIRQPRKQYLLVPKVSSMNRDYIPIGFVDPDIIASGSALVIDGATLFHFGVLCSAIHNSWMRTVGGRMKSDYQYSIKIVYNNFCWPTDLTDNQIKKVETSAQKVLTARTNNSGKALAELYRIGYMPSDLVDAHRELDKAVDACYRKKPFISEMERVQYLFGLYEQATAPLAVAAAAPKPKRKAKR